MATNLIQEELKATVAAVNTGKGPGMLPTCAQSPLADATIGTFMAPADGYFLAVSAFVGAPCAGTADAEKTEIDLLVSGASILTAPIALTHAIGSAVVQGVFATTGFHKGDILAVVNNYTADGGGGNTGDLLFVSIGFRLT
jgi:hypothetical protein